MSIKKDSIPFEIDVGPIFQTSIHIAIQKQSSLKIKPNIEVDKRFQTFPQKVGSLNIF